jgi:cytochrome P450
MNNIVKKLIAPILAKFDIPYLWHIPGPRGIEFFKLMLHFQRDSLGALEETYKKYGKVVSYPWPVSTIILYDTKLIKDVLIDRKQIYVKGSQTDKMKVVLGDGLVTNNDRESWLRNRVIVSKEMNTKSIKGFSSVIKLKADELVEKFKIDIGESSDGKIDIALAMKNITFSIAGQTLLGASLTDDDAKSVDEAVLFTSKKAHDHMFQFLPIPYWVPTPSNNIFHNHCKKLDEIVYRLIDEAMVGREKNLFPNSILERLVYANDPVTEKPLDRKTLRDEVLTLLIAGYETTSNSLIWILGLIASDQDSQRKIQLELDSQNDEIESMDFSKKYPHLYFTILEGIRLYTTIPMSSRKTTDKDIYGEYEIPKNTSIVIPAWVIHRHHDFWNDPLSFNPLRFENLDVNTLDNYVPFSKGGRRCVGESFATVEIAIIISTILKTFNVALVDKSLPRAISHVTLKPENGLFLKLIKRDQQC